MTIDANTAETKSPDTSANLGALTLSHALGDRRKDLQIFLFSLILYGLVLLPILLADRYHLEDISRLIRGVYGWVGEGRPLTAFVMMVLNLFGPMTDIAPIPQLAGISLLAYSTVWIAHRFEIESPLQAALAALPLGGSPFFLENLSFRFDSLGMCLAIVLALVPALLLQQLNWKSWGIGALSLLASLSFYQTGINAFLVFAVTEIVFAQFKGVPFRSLGRLAGLRFLQLMAGLLAYVLLARFMVSGSYNLQHFAYVSRLSELHTIRENWNHAWTSIFESLPAKTRNIFLYPAYLALAIIVLSSGLYLRKCIRAGAGKCEIAILVLGLFVLPFAWLAGSLGPVIFTVQTVITLPRIFLGTGALLASTFVIICTAASRLQKSTRWVTVLLCVPAYAMVMMASLLGNALVEQGKYEDRIGNRLSFDLKELARNRPLKELILSGNAPYSPVVRRATDRYKVFRLPMNLSDDRFLGDYIGHIFEYYGITVKPENSDERRSLLITEAAQTKPVLSNGDYSISVVGDVAVVSLSDGSSK
jgi:hypothetical protein